MTDYGDNDCDIYGNDCNVDGEGIFQSLEGNAVFDQFPAGTATFNPFPASNAYVNRSPAGNDAVNIISATKHGGSNVTVGTQSTPYNMITTTARQDNFTLQPMAWTAPKAEQIRGEDTKMNQMNFIFNNVETDARYGGHMSALLTVICVEEPSALLPVVCF
jgi:hypothetical protein